jgi:acyl carrier protein
MATREKLKSLLMECVNDYAEQTGNAVKIDDNTPLLGAESAIDSLGLVMIVTGFEARVNESFDSGIVLANEAAMSMRRSPFRSVAALAEYAEQLLVEAKAA